MDEHPGDTLGNRFLTFWGVLGTLALLALALALFRWIAIPADDAVNDGGAGNSRLAILSQTTQEEEAAYREAVEVEAGKTVRLPADTVIPFAAKALAKQKAAPGPLKTPEAIAREAKSSHDPNLSIFEGK